MKHNFHTDQTRAIHRWLRCKKRCQILQSQEGWQHVKQNGSMAACTVTVFFVLVVVFFLPLAVFQRCHPTRSHLRQRCGTRSRGREHQQLNQPAGMDPSHPTMPSAAASEGSLSCEWAPTNEGSRRRGRVAGWSVAELGRGGGLLQLQGATAVGGSVARNRKDAVDIRLRVAAPVRASATCNRESRRRRGNGCVQLQRVVAEVS